MALDSKSRSTWRKLLIKDDVLILFVAVVHISYKVCASLCLLCCILVKSFLLLRWRKHSEDGFQSTFVFLSLVLACHLCDSETDCVPSLSHPCPIPCSDPEHGHEERV